MKKTQKRYGVDDMAATVDGTGSVCRATVADELMSVHCGLLSYIGLTVLETAAANRGWDIRTDPVVRICAARMTELARRER